MTTAVKRRNLAVRTKKAGPKSGANGQQIEHQEKIYELELDGKPVMAAQMWIPVGDLDVDERYQRTINETRAERIAAKWSWVVAGLLTVSARGKRYVIIDGQHRARALAIRGEPKAWCQVFFDLTPAQEAYIFDIRNTSAVSLNSIGGYRARLAYHDPQSLRIKAALEGVGLRVGAGARDPSIIQAMSALKTLENWGVLLETLTLVRRAWPTQIHAKGRIALLGVGMFVWNFKNKIHGTRFQEQLDAAPLAEMIGNARSMKATLGQREWEHFARVVCRLYDKGRSANALGEQNMRVPHTEGSGADKVN